MSTERVLPVIYAAESYWGNPPLLPAGVKRKYDSVFPSGPRKRTYPSPPMSRQSSPPFSGTEPSHSAVNEAASLVSASSAPPNLIAATLPAPPHGYSATPPRPPSPLRPYAATIPDPSPLSQLAGTATAPPIPPSGAVFPATTIATGSPAVAVAPGTPGQLSARSGRKSKAHVASACINCKRAHLSCDIQRPCARCVASGKQDTCYDVQHKKRGRPRLREESDFKIEQMMPEQPTGLPMLTANTANTPRPIATPRQRRADSLRSLRSQTGDASSSSTTMSPGFHPPPPPSSYQPPLGFQQPQPIGTPLAPSEVPTAFLDVDLFVLRANRPFQQILSGGQEIRGHYLGDIVAPADNESFQAIRNRLRTEREEREPAYMPPIGQSGLDPIQGVSEGDVERLTHGFTDQSYIWTRNRPGADTETFPVRIRLAKALAYFVVVTLPTFRPAGAFAIPQTSPRSAQQTHISPRSAHQTHISPRSAHQTYGHPLNRPPLPSPGLPPLQPLSSSAQAFLSSQQRIPPLPPTLPSTPQLSVSETPVTTPSMQTRPSSREVTQPPPPGGVQLAPIITSPVIMSDASGVRRQSQQLQAVSSSEEEGDERSPKRIRVGIPDVLQP